MTDHTLGVGVLKDKRRSAGSVLCVTFDVRPVKGLNIMSAHYRQRRAWHFHVASCTIHYSIEPIADIYI